MVFVEKKTTNDKKKREIEIEINFHQSLTPKSALRCACRNAIACRISVRKSRIASSILRLYFEHNIKKKTDRNYIKQKCTHKKKI